ncbi:hypothetical protein Baya_5880 [Bagarius yarrelli]|uniref:Uncharacterized protein n=1 Tax=Bagarius yarrelli TaxID=175774 RepID=A0A556TXT9_BAGYA|nr:hypothetical protein Baya_5880 [Bagarius yarrelli]
MRPGPRGLELAEKACSAESFPKGEVQLQISSSKEVKAMVIEGSVKLPTCSPVYEELVEETMIGKLLLVFGLLISGSEVQLWSVKEWDSIQTLKITPISEHLQEK